MSRNRLTIHDGSVLIRRLVEEYALILEYAKKLKLDSDGWQQTNVLIRGLSSIFYASVSKFIAG